jgi:hypothetical protein
MGTYASATTKYASTATQGKTYEMAQAAKATAGVKGDVQTQIAAAGADPTKYRVLASGAILDNTSGGYITLDQIKATLGGGQTSSVEPMTIPTAVIPKDPTIYPTAPGGAMEGKVIAAAGNAQNQVVLDAYAASGGTTTSTYRDEYTNEANPGETALQEAARLQAAGSISIFNKVAAAAENAIMTVTNITGANTETAKQALIKYSPISSGAGEIGAIINAQVVQEPLITLAPLVGTSMMPDIFGLTSSSPWNPLPDLLKPVDGVAAGSLPAIVQNIPQYLSDQAKIANMHVSNVDNGWFDNLKLPDLSGIDLTPGFNLGISEALNNAGQTLNEIAQIPQQIQQGTQTANKTLSLWALLLGAGLIFLTLKKK